MTTWVQLKDGVAFASVDSPNFVGNSIPLEDGITFDDIKAMKYENGEWSIAPLIYFVHSMKDGLVTGVNSTVFASDAVGIICPPEVDVFWTFTEEGGFVPPLSAPSIVIEPPVEEV